MQKKQKRLLHKYIKYDELDEAIHATEARLYYLRNRKKTGIPGGLSNKDKKNKMHDADYAYYNYWVMNRDFLAKYKNLREEMTVSAKRFVTYHNRIMRVVDKFGTDAEKDALKKIMGNNAEELSI